MYTLRMRGHWKILASGLLAAALVVPAMAYAGDHADCSSGSVLEMDPVRYVSACLNLAGQGYDEAQFNLGLIHDTGHGVPQDYSEAFEWYLPAAKAGFVPAQFNLGNMYYYGWGVPQDHVQAAYWHRMAAENGHAWSQHNLAWMYQNGQGVPKNTQEAVRLYRAAADQGFALSQHDLGYLYATGQGVELNYVNALKWFDLAAAQGDPRAVQSSAFMQQRMSVQQVTRAEQLAASFQPVSQFELHE
jgi:TPR repeat protein